MGCDIVKIIKACFWTVSIHAPRVGCDRFGISYVTNMVTFQFTHPVWGATHYAYQPDEHFQFQFTHPVWGATGNTADIISSS